MSIKEEFVKACKDSGGKVVENNGKVVCRFDSKGLEIELNKDLLVVKTNKPLKYIVPPNSTSTIFKAFIQEMKDATD